MHYSDYVKAVLLATINELAADPGKYAVNPGKDFTRHRKMGFREYLLMFLSMEGECIKEELYRYFGRTTDAPSKAAFYKQRQKLRDDALRNLLIAFNRKLKKIFITGNTSLSPAMVPPLIFTGIPMTRIPSLNPTANPPGALTKST